MSRKDTRAAHARWSPRNQLARTNRLAATDTAINATRARLDQSGYAIASGPARGFKSDL